MGIRRIFSFIAVLLLLPGLQGCGVYSFSGGSVGDAKTVSIAFFPNKAVLVNPSLSQVFTEKLKDKFLRESRLSLVQQDGDFDFSGYITTYVVAPASVQGDNQVRSNRLTMGVHVKFVSKTDTKLNFERDFSQFSDFDASKTLAQVESDVVQDVTDKLVQDIFAAAVMNW